LIEMSVTGSGFAAVVEAVAEVMVGTA